MKNSGAIILAAGNGKRMKTEKPKALCEVLFKPMLDHVVSSLIQAEIKDICIVIGKGGDQIKKHVSQTSLYSDCNVTFAVQNEQLGTGHAVMQANDFIKSKSGENIIILCGDAPFIDKETILNSYNYHKENGYDGTVISANLEDPTGYGRIIRNEKGVCGICEHKDTDEKTVLIKEVNSGAFWFKADGLYNALSKIKNNNSQNEYYLTDTLEILNSMNKKVGGFTALSNDIVLGANDRKTLMQLNEIANKRNLEKHLANGIEIIISDGIIIGDDVTIENGTKILPNSIIIKGSKIGKNCIIGPSSYIENSVISDNSKIVSSYVSDYDATENFEPDFMGPFDSAVEYFED